MATNNINIPKGWDIKKLGEIFSFSAGGDVDKDCFSDVKDDLHPYPIYANALTNKGLYGYSSKYKIKNECITITGRGDIGKVFYREGKFTPIVRLITAIPKNNINTKFMSYSCSRIKFFNENTGVPQLTVPQVSWYKVVVPPLAEQEKIAEILSCWDEAIEKVSDLIEQKKLLKKGLMQKLLTDKTRLSGFTQPWKEVKLGEIAEFILGYSFDSNDFKENGIPLIRISNIEDDKLSLDKDTVFLDTSSLQKYQKYCIKQQDLLIAMSGATTGKMGINKTVTPMLLNQRVGIIRAKKSNQCFINQYLMRFNNKILRMSYGGAQPNIGSNDIKKIKLFIPSDISEQQAIADVLSTADDEINLLNQKLEALKTQKKGLMQQLLTGKIRVKVNK